MTTGFANALAESVWEQRYRFAPASGAPESSIDATWDRVARALAAGEPRDREHWAGRFREALSDFRFLPGGRILAGAGTARRVTLFNCFVMGTVEDSLDGIFAALRESALTMQQGGGIGVDFSTLRPYGALADATGGMASGPVSFMDLWNQMSETVTGVGPRRGAMMGTLACEHPDVLAFVEAKRRPGRLTHFNLSVLVSDAFMRAVEVGADWTLAFPRFGVERRVAARALWEGVVQSAYESAEPGVLFIDRIRAEDNLAYAETISATNPCGEIPLPPYGACDLGSINLTRFVREAFSPRAALDLRALADTAAVAARMLDDVYEVSTFPLPQQAAAAKASRRLGIGITGLADALAMLGLRYDAADGRNAAAAAMRTICEAAYAASIELARERGSFERFARERYLAAPFVQRLPQGLRDGIARHGIRNSHLTAIAPAGTISLLAGNVSSGLEPIFALEYARDVRRPGGAVERVGVESHALAQWRERSGDTPLPPAFVTAAEVPAEAQVEMQAALQPHVDNAISKTTNVPADIPLDEFRAIYRRAWERGLKGCTVFRPNRVTGAVLTGPEPRCERCEVAPAP
ncbi:MAG: adenosylcobalamin-dependent ribonucleoside-diphosphate reductase [Betaproteobacteria bacterium]|nr:adenosylcobalamin-dependent ribonucleoside-diphosphate reductase [Betaproteobacteria bacterium]